MRVISFIILLFGLSGCLPMQTIEIEQRPPKAEVSNLIKRIPIAIRDYGYHHFKTQVITNEHQLNLFLSQVEKESGWEKKENFLNTIRMKKIDFKRNNLLIYRVTENSGAIVLAVKVPTELNGHLFVKIGKNESNTMTSDMAYYSFAYIVDKNVIDVTFEEGDSNITISNR